MHDNTAAARKALQRIRQIKRGLVRVEVNVPADRKQEIVNIAEQMRKEAAK